MTAAFYAVFGAFALSMVVIAVLAVRWAVRRDRLSRIDAAAGRGGGPATPGAAS